MEKIRIGCSGYYYPSWKGKFYPQDLKPSQWLEYYSTQFNTVELNGTFYRKPKLSDLKKYFSRTPDDFSFSVKANRYITHTLKLKNAAEYVKEFSQLLEEGLKTKFEKLLFQFPPSFKFSDENLDLICENVPANKRNVLEFRDKSWWNKKTVNRFSELSYNFCNVDYPGLDVPFVNTSPEFYLRLHGVPELFKSPYSERQLKIFYNRIPPKSISRHIYFNNTYYEAAFLNARSMMKISEQKKSPLKLIS